MEKKDCARKKVFVGMSGGVDSSVSAYLLKKEGYDVVGVFINGYNIDGCAERDAEDARRAAEHIGIPFYVLNLKEEYFDLVVKDMIEGYKKGITPNPDVLCNKEIKFGLFLEKALKLGADYIATGHYVSSSLSQNFFSRTGCLPAPAAGTTLRSQPQNFRSAEDQAFAASESFSQKNSERISLFEGKDKNKDQSYFLWTLTQNQLKRSLFPLGGYIKEEVRKIAKKAKLPNAEKKDSQGICFLGQVKLPEFLSRFIKSKKGDILDTNGNKVGKHDGVQFYTIGQRHIGVSLNTGGGERKPLYVVKKDTKKNTLTVADGGSPLVFKDLVELKNLNIITPILSGEEVLARIRYRQPLFKAKFVFRGKNPKSANLLFEKPQKFVAVGQSAVFYSPPKNRITGTHELLGGGIIMV